MANHSHIPNNKKPLKKSKEGSDISHIHDKDLDFNGNQIFLFGREEYIDREADNEPGIEYAIANRFIRNMQILQAKSDNTILIHMKSCGGDSIEGMAIYDTIKACPNDVIILNYTHARSMTSIIFQAADKRVMMPHSYFLIHEGTLGYSGTRKQTRSYVAFDERTCRKQMLDIYTQKLTAHEGGRFYGEKESKIRAWLQRQMDKAEDVYWTAEDAVELGFADEIFGADGVYDWKKLWTVS